jgi:AcrR family transcriptional regulator
MRDLGSELGCSAMAIYAYFPDRGAVLHAAAEAVWREVISELDYSETDPIEFSIRAGVALVTPSADTATSPSSPCRSSPIPLRSQPRQNIMTAVSLLF